MIARTEVKFSEEQIVRAEYRSSYQKTIIGRLKSGSASRSIILMAEDLLYLMKNRVVLLHERHAALLAEQAGERSAEPLITPRTAGSIHMERSGLYHDDNPAPA